MCLLSDRWRSTYLSEMACFQTFGEEPMFIFFKWKMIKCVTIKWLVVVVEDFGIL